MNGIEARKIISEQNRSYERQRKINAKLKKNILKRNTIGNSKNPLTLMHFNVSKENGLLEKKLFIKENSKFFKGNPSVPYKKGGHKRDY